MKELPVYRGWNAKIYYEGVEIGYVTEVRIEIDHSVEPYFETFTRQASTLVEGPIQIMGKFRRAWVDVTYLSLLTSTESLSTFDLAVKVGTRGPTVYLYNCKFKKGTIVVPQDGFLTEDYDFIATSLATRQCPTGEQILNGGFEDGLENWETSSGVEATNVTSHSGSYSCWIPDQAEYAEQGWENPIPVECVISFKFWSKSQCSCPGCAGVVCEVLYDDESTSAHTFSASESNWFERDMKPYLESGKKILNIRFTSDSSMGLYIDDVSLICS